MWEITLKHQLGKLRLPEPPRFWIEAQSSAWHLQAISITREHMYRSSELPMHHKDPFDRLLAAQSIVEAMPIVTPDAHLNIYPVATLW